MALIEHMQAATAAGFRPEVGSWPDLEAAIPGSARGPQEPVGSGGTGVSTDALPERSPQAAAPVVQGGSNAARAAAAS